MLTFSRWKTALIWCAVLVSILVALPNLLTSRQAGAVASWLPGLQVDPGADLQGGSRLVMKVEQSDIVKNRLSDLLTDVRGALRDAGIAYTGLYGMEQTVEVKISDPAEYQAALRILEGLTLPLAGEDQKSGGAVEIQTNADGVFSLVLTQEGIADLLRPARARSVNVVSRRVRELGVPNMDLRLYGNDRIVLDVSGLDDWQRLKSLLNQPARFSMHLIDTSMAVAEAVNSGPPAGSDIIYTLDDPAVPFLVERRAFVTGRNVIDAQAGLDEGQDEAFVTFRLDDEGTRLLQQVTSANPGRAFAVVLDEQVIALQTIQAPVTDGVGKIAANFSTEGVDDLSALLRSGALPATLTILEERSFSAPFGLNSLDAQIWASIAAFVAVALFMVGFYGFFGIIANIALVVNITMIVAVLSITGANLTLSGIAGIVLTMGIAVDSNVLVYERIREEVKSGRRLAQAIGNGFRGAWTSIVDSNLTTLIAVAVLFWVGSDTARGFALTLAIGIATTVFTAFTFTALLLGIWFRRTRPRMLAKGIRTEIFDSRNMPFIKLRRYIFGAASVAMAASVIGYAVFGMNMGVDFEGGSIVEIEARGGAVDIDDIADRLVQLNLADAVISQQTPQEAAIRIPPRDAGENAEQSAITLLRSALDDTYDFRRVEVVGPTVSGELTRVATLGIVAAMFAILVYIWLRFEWQFALGAIIATMHDVILTIGVFVLTGMEFNLLAIAAMLAIVGYSLKDTVVVYDRIRENIKRYPKMPIRSLLDASINQTMSRTLLTGLTTILALGALFVFGAPLTRGFSLIMMFGVILGTFSSVYIAAPVLIAFKLPNEAVQPEEADAEQPVRPGQPDVADRGASV